MNLILNVGNKSMNVNEAEKVNSEEKKGDERNASEKMVSGADLQTSLLSETDVLEEVPQTSKSTEDQVADPSQSKRVF